MMKNWGIVLILVLGLVPPGVAHSSDVNYTVPGQFFRIQQPKTMACWATVATMLSSWKQQTKRTIPDVLDGAGAVYRQLYEANVGLSSSDKTGFLTAAKLFAEPPASYNANGLMSLMKAHGPLWVTTAEPNGAKFSIHARVLTGIMGDGTGDGTTLMVVDPDDGQTHLESLSDFTKKIETLAKSDYGDGADPRPLIVHF
jgi:hypothetical protein